MLMIRIIRNWGWFFALLELVVIILVIKAIGFWATIFLLLLSSFLGLFLLRLAGAHSRIAIQNEFSSKNITSPEESVKSLVLMITGLLFLLPGFITSFLAILCLLPVIGSVFAIKLAAFGHKKRTGDSERIIEGEFQRKDP